ncbi:MAG: ectonucleotide pyrophosphatase/phosphodiesterase, partial [Pyrinomonadaceae bacterium]
ALHPLLKSMTTYKIFLPAVLLALTLFSDAAAQKPVKDLKPTVILISLDGFRYDYLDKFAPPTLNRLAKEGVRAKWMTPSFPTKTFPNHYTIATGLYPEHHGIIENNIWDFGSTFTLNKREEVQNSRWWLGEPIWVTAETQNVRVGAFFFPGTEAEIGGRRPTFWKHYDGKIPNNDRVDQILSWIDLPQAERPRLYTLYFSDVDDAGHGFSPDSEETRKAELTVDENVRRLMDGLQKRKIDRKVNVIIVSDHGMATVDQRNAIVMDDYLDGDTTMRVLTTGEIWQIFPKPNTENEIMDKLKLVRHASCWRKSEIPERLHYRASPRIAPIVCSADEGWFMTSRERFEAQKKRADFGQLKGAHGYDNQIQVMRATFIAHGRAFKKKKLVEPFENIHVYELMCKILGLKPAKNDGNLKRVRGMLR